MGELMGLQQTGDRDLATRFKQMNLVAAGDTTEPVEMNGPFYFIARGGAGELVLEFSMDGGTTWLDVQGPGCGSIIWAPPVHQVVPNVPREDGVLFRVRALTVTAGPIAVRLSSGGPL